jgi:hypothetical protein
MKEKETNSKNDRLAQALRDNLKRRKLPRSVDSAQKKEELPPLSKKD